MSMPTYRVTDALPDGDADAVKSTLREFNRSRSPDFFAKRDLPENAARPLHVVAHDADGAVVGGLIAETQFLWLHIDMLSVREAARGQGVGRRLMVLAEDEARRRGCKYAVVDTMSYQAPGFYERLGYAQAGLFRDWDSHGHDKFYFTKRL